MSVHQEANINSEGATALDKIWDAVVLADSKYRPDKSCYGLYEEYKNSGRTIDECVSNLIKWQVTKTSASGFVTGVPGFVALPVTIPADIAVVVYVQLRMVVVIGLLHGWSINSDQLKTMAYLCLIGASVGEVLHEAGVKVGAKVSAQLINKIPGKVLIAINKKVGFRLVTKAGEKGVINLMKLVPVLGGVAGGGMNALSTWQIGRQATNMFRGGPCVTDDLEASQF